MLKLPKLSIAARIWTIAAVLIVALIAWLAWPRPASVVVAAIDTGEVRREVAEEGRVRFHDVYTIAAPVGGQLQRIKLEAGDEVKAGDTVASIAPADPSLLDARIAEEANATVKAAQAALALAEADLDLAKADEQRTADLFARGFAAQAALDRTRNGLKVARSVVEQRKAELNRALAAVGRPGARARKPTAVRSPATGRVLRVLQESEMVVAPGMPLIEIGDPNEVEVVAEFLSQDAALMREGAPAFVENWGRNQSLPARVKTVEPYARTKVSALGVEEQRVNVVLNFADTGAEGMPQLGHGFRVDARVVVFDQQDVLRVPTDALIRQQNNGWAVFRVRDGHARLTLVKIGDGDDHFRVLRDGVEAGDRVVLFPGDTLKDGDPVRGEPVRDEPAR